MLRRNAQLAADMVFAQFLQERSVRIREQIVKADTRADKYLLHLRQRSQLPQQFEVIAVINDKIRTGFRIQALAVCAGAVFQLFVAGRSAEFRCRSADVMDISLKSLSFKDCFASSMIDSWLLTCTILP